MNAEFLSTMTDNNLRPYKGIGSLSVSMIP